ncbi:MAG: hypothetical protein JXA69_11395 [Phycisphaerae bacterium]|nr:hypothetical protein [Phycisphaerae bacterium]
MATRNAKNHEKEILFLCLLVFFVAILPGGLRLSFSRPGDERKPPAGLLTRPTHIYAVSVTGSQRFSVVASRYPLGGVPPAWLSRPVNSGVPHGRRFCLDVVVAQQDKPLLSDVLPRASASEIGHCGQRPRLAE